MNNFYYDEHAQSERMKGLKPEFQKLLKALLRSPRLTVRGVSLF